MRSIGRATVLVVFAAVCPGIGQLLPSLGKSPFHVVQSGGQVFFLGFYPFDFPAIDAIFGSRGFVS